MGFKKGVKLVFYVKDPNFEDRRFDGKFVADTLKQKVGNGGKLFDITMLRVEPYGMSIRIISTEHTKRFTMTCYRAWLYIGPAQFKLPGNGFPYYRNLFSFALFTDT